MSKLLHAPERYTLAAIKKNAENIEAEVLRATRVEAALNEKNSEQDAAMAIVRASADTALEKVGVLEEGATALSNRVDLKADLVGGKVPAAQLPSYVDDVIERANKTLFPSIGESGKIYVALDTNKTYRWGGSTYVEISESLAIGETAETAFAGDRGVALEAGKVDKVDGKGLSTEDYTTEEKEKLGGIEAGAQKNPDLSGYALKKDIPAPPDLTPYAKKSEAWLVGGNAEINIAESASIGKLASEEITVNEKVHLTAEGEGGWTGLDVTASEMKIQNPLYQEPGYPYAVVGADEIAICIDPPGEIYDPESGMTWSTGGYVGMSGYGVVTVRDSMGYTSMIYPSSISFLRPPNVDEWNPDEAYADIGIGGMIGFPLIHGDMVSCNNLDIYSMLSLYEETILSLSSTSYISFASADWSEECILDYETVKALLDLLA